MILYGILYRKGGGGKRGKIRKEVLLCEYEDGGQKMFD